MKRKSYSPLELVQGVAILVMGLGFFTLVYLVLGWLLLLVAPGFGRTFARKLAEQTPVDIIHGPFLALAYAAVLLAAGFLLLIAAGTLAKRNEELLKKRLKSVRTALTKYKKKTGRYPESLQALVAAGNLKSIPSDPIRWPRSGWSEERDESGGIRNIHSKSGSSALDGRGYDEL